MISRAGWRLWKIRSLAARGERPVFRAHYLIRQSLDMREERRALELAQRDRENVLSMLMRHANIGESSEHHPPIH